MDYDYETSPSSTLPLDFGKNFTVSAETSTPLANIIYKLDRGRESSIRMPYPIPFFGLVVRA